VCKELPVILVNRGVDKKRIIGKMEGRGGGGKEQNGYGWVISGVDNLNFEMLTVGNLEVDKITRHLLITGRPVSSCQEFFSRQVCSLHVPDENKNIYLFYLWPWLTRKVTASQSCGLQKKEDITTAFICWRKRHLTRKKNFLFISAVVVFFRKSFFLRMFINKWRQNYTLVGFEPTSRGTCSSQ
jgi:hypothetical protein